MCDAYTFLTMWALGFLIYINKLSFELQCLNKTLQKIKCILNTHFFSVIMPPSALDQLSRLHILFPMLFKLTNKRTNRITHCGVLEFVADEGKVYLPYWV